MQAKNRLLRRIVLVIASSLLGTCTTAQAALVLTVDATDPHAVVFVGLDALSEGTSSGTGYGILLLGAVQADNAFGELNPPGRTLGPAAGGVYNAFSERGTSIDINGGGLLNQVFTTGLRAFAGQTTVDLSLMQFPATSVTGDIHVRNDFGNDIGILIGQYSLTVAGVPEPSTLALGAIAAFGALRLRQRRRSEARKGTLNP
jgi:hypothetical protein